MLAVLGRWCDLPIFYVNSLPYKNVAPNLLFQVATSATLSDTICFQWQDLISLRGQVKEHVGRQFNHENDSACVQDHAQQ